MDRLIMLWKKSPNSHRKQQGEQFKLGTKISFIMRKGYLSGDLKEELTKGRQWGKSKQKKSLGMLQRYQKRPSMSEM